MAATMFAPGFDGAVLPIGTRIPMQQRYRAVANEYGLDETTALLNALIGAAAGGVATKSRARVQHNSGGAADNGGKMKTETFTPINRVSTAGDVTQLKTLFAGVRRAPSPYPVDRSGNGGPAFTPG